MGALALVTITYLVIVYVVKQWFFKRYKLDSCYAQRFAFDRAERLGHRQHGIVIE